jgi:hypothetical protein
MSDPILAIDLGRYKSVACGYSRPTREHTFRTVDSTPDGIDLPRTGGGGVWRVRCNGGITLFTSPTVRGR